MSTVSDKSQHSYADADDFIQYQLEKARSRIKATDLLTAGVLAGLLLVGYILIFTLLDHWVVAGGFGAITRAVLLAVVVLLCATILYRYVLRPWFRRVHPLYAARMLDRSSNEIQGSLLALVDLQAAGFKSDGAIHRTLEKRAAVTLANVHVDEAIDRRLLTRMGTGLFIITLITCLYAVLSPKSISLLRPLTFVRTSVATRTVIESVQPGNASLAAGSQLEFIADLAGVIPDEVRVLYSTADHRFVDEALEMHSTDDEHRFRVVMTGDGDRGIRQGMTYRVVAGDATSETYAITVEQPPTSRVTEVRYVYPAYMNLPQRTDSAGTIEAWEDTTVTLLAESSEPVTEAVLQMSDDAAFASRGEELQMAIDGNQLSVDWKLTHREDGTFPKFYRIQVANADGHRDLDPVVYSVDIRRDQPPVLKLVDPTRDLEVPANAIVPLLVEAEDPDFLLRSVTLHYAVNGKLIQPSEVLLDAFQTGLTKRWTDTWEFRLKPLNLNPGDVVTFHLEARDNRPPLGNQSRTGDLNLQITAPVSEQQAQEQLAQDRQMQDQMKPPESGTPNEAQQNPGEDPAGQQPQTGEQTENPAPNETQPPDPNQEQPDDGTDGNKDDNGKQPEQNGATDPRNSNDGNRDQDAQPGKSPEQNQPGQEGSESRSQKRRVDDDMALQKAIEQMNRKPQDSEEKGKSENQDATGEDRRPGTEPNPERPGREPDAQENDGKNTTDSGDGSDQKTAEPPGDDSRTGDQARDAKSGADETSDEKQNPEDARETAKSEKPPSEESPASPSDSTAEKNTPGAKSDDKPVSEELVDKPAKEAGSDKPPMQNENPLNMNSKTGRQSDPGKTGDESSEESKSGNEKSSSKKPGDEKSAGEKSAGEKSTGEKSAGEKSAGEKSAGEKSAGEKSTGEKAAGEKAAGEKSAGEKSAGEKAGGEKAAGEKAGGEKAGGEKAGGEKAGGEKAGGEKAGGEKAGGEKAGGEKAGGEKAGGEKAGGEKAGGEKAGGEKAGGEKAGGEKGDGQKGDEGGSEGGKESEGDGTSSSDSQGSGKGNVVKTIKRGDPREKGIEDPNAAGEANGNQPDGVSPQDAVEPKENEKTNTDDPQADDVAHAASLALKRLQKDLDRGEVDPKLLEELGWTEAELKTFVDRMQKQLQERELNSQQQKEKSISQKSFDAMLKGLDIKSTGSTRQGRNDRDRDQTDTTTRQSTPPARYRQRVEGYQRSVPDMKETKP